MTMRLHFPHIHQIDSTGTEAFYQSYRPVFVLSTGRCGSSWIVEAFKLSDTASAWHEPRPALMHMASFPLSNRDPELHLEIIRACRFESMLEVFLEGQIYIESNQCLTFFLPALIRLFPKALFLHLIRHPGYFCASAIRKGWYENDSIWEAGRIRPAEPARWEREKSQVEKLAWNWTVVNGFIHAHLQGLPPCRHRLVPFERMFSDTDFLAGIFDFCGVSPVSFSELKRMQTMAVNRLEAPQPEPPNMRKRHDAPPFEHWSDSDREALKKACPGSVRWGYEL